LRYFLKLQLVAVFSTKLYNHIDMQKRKTWRMKLVRLRWKPWFNGCSSPSVAGSGNGTAWFSNHARNGGMLGFHHSFRAKKNQFMRVNNGE